MSTNHNRIKVSDLEQNQPNKTLITNTNGELEFSAVSNIKTESYNALDYTADGKALDARQGKVLKDMINNISASPISLINDLTTGGTAKALTAEMGKILQSNKVDKTAGERLINAAEIAKLESLSNLVTTVKTISSSALTSKDLTGFISYINTLNTILIVGKNETVTYKTSDTGRVFELLLRDRSFGKGQPAITNADAIEVTEFLNKDLTLSNYPNTRNDGVNPTNKFLGTDANGQIRSYAIAAFPQPYLSEFVPNTNLPNTTGYIVLKGAFFTPNMTVAITGQTINFKSFINDNEIKIHITTSSVGGSYNITLNNGSGDVVFPNRFFVINGTITEPLAGEWVNIGNNLNVSLGNTLKMTSYGSNNSVATWNKVIDYTKNFSVFFSFNLSPLGLGNLGALTLDVIGATTGGVFATTGGGAGYYYCKMYAGAANQYSLNSDRESWKNSIIEYRYVGGNLSIYVNGVYYFNTGVLLTENVKLRFYSRYVDIANIKYIEY